MNAVATRAHFFSQIAHDRLIITLSPTLGHTGLFEGNCSLPKFQYDRVGNTGRRATYT
jgi:hypothetical protein